MKSNRPLRDDNPTIGLLAIEQLAPFMKSNRPLRDDNPRLGLLAIEQLAPLVLMCAVEMVNQWHRFPFATSISPGGICLNDDDSLFVLVLFGQGLSRIVIWLLRNGVYSDV